MLVQFADPCLNQADAIAELEGQLAKAHESERSYQEATDQLNADVNALELECYRLKQQLSNAPERSGRQPPN